MKAFVSNEYPTLGVEEEFHLVDPDSGAMVPRVDEVMALLDGQAKSRVSLEVFQSVIEAMSGVARTAGDLVADISDARRRLAAVCEQVGVRLVAAGSHPFCDWREEPFVDTPHYRWVRENHGIICQRLLSFGLHVHVGLRSAEAALYVMYEMRRWVFALLALSVNSPLCEGRVTGLESTRTHLFNGMPRTFLPPPFETFDELTDYYEKLHAAGDVARPGDLWWSIRPQPPLGTVEIRSMDLPTNVHRIGALAALFQAAVATYQDAFFRGEPRSRMADEYLEHHRWRAMRDGLDATVVDPDTLEVVPMRHYVGRLIDLVAPKAEELGAGEYLELARTLAEGPTEARQQIALHGELGGDLAAVELELARRTLVFDRPG